MVTVTNKEIYEQLLIIEKQVINLNGRVTLNRWMASTAIVMIGVVMIL